MIGADLCFDTVFEGLQGEAMMSCAVGRALSFNVVRGAVAVEGLGWGLGLWLGLVDCIHSIEQVLALYVQAKMASRGFELI